MRISAPNCHSLRLVTQWQDWQAMDILKRKLGRIGKAIYRATIRDGLWQKCRGRYHNPRWEAVGCASYMCVRLLCVRKNFVVSIECVRFYTDGFLARR
jgi:hypothetical protein